MKKKGETINISRLVNEIFNSLFKSKNSNKLFSKPNTYKDNPILSGLVLNNPISDKPKNEKNFDEIIYEYICKFKSEINKKYFSFFLKFILLLREYFNIIKKNDKKIETKKAASEILSAMDIPELINDFYEFLTKNKYFKVNETNEIIDITKHFCIWLFKNEYTKINLEFEYEV